MNKRMSFNAALLLVTFLLIQDSHAQDYTRWGLPEGAKARLGKGNIGWGDRAMAYSPDGTRLAVASSIGIWLYDARTGAEVALFTGHTMAFSPDGKTIASASAYDGPVRLWDVATGQLKNTIKGYTVAFSPDGTSLSITSQNEGLRVWDGTIPASVDSSEFSDVTQPLAAVIRQRRVEWP